MSTQVIIGVVSLLPPVFLWHNTKKSTTNPDYILVWVLPLHFPLKLPLFYFMISLSLLARHGYPTGGLCCHVPVWHPGVRLHHGSSCPYPGIPAQICVRITSSRHQWTPCYYLCNYRHVQNISCFLHSEIVGIFIFYTDSGDYLQ